MFIRRPDARLHALSFGHGPRTLLAIGGWVGSGEVWHDLFGHLGDWRCISVDHRGTGFSAHEGPITVPAMVDDLLAVADAMGADRCVLAAESAGAQAALGAVLKAPHRFDGLVLVDPSWQRPPPGAMDAMIAGVRRDHDATLRAFVDACLPEPNTEDLRRWGFEALRRSSADDAVALLECRAHFDVEPRLGEIEVSTLIVHGELDRITPPDASRALLRRLRHAELHLLPGLGHVPIVTAPAAVARLIHQRFPHATAPAEPLV